MPTVRIETLIRAAPEACFDLARSQRAHAASTRSTGERVVTGPSNDLLELGDEVTFEARHLGIRQRFTARITEMERPAKFADEMTRGAFRSLRHVHLFLPESDGTRMVDELMFDAPLGFVSHRILVPYMRRFLRARGQELKRMAENGGRLP